LSVGAHRGETDIDRGRRRIVVGYLVIGAGTRLIAGVSELSGGSPQVWIDPPAALISLILLGLLWRKPAWFVGIVSAILFIGLAEILAGTIVSGGLVPSEMVILWGVVIVLGALITLSVRAAFLWFVAYAVTLVLAVVLPERISPLEMEEGSPAGIAFTIMAVTSFVFAGMAYFVRPGSPTSESSAPLPLPASAWLCLGPRRARHP
jgi:hypothetical protein